MHIQDRKEVYRGVRVAGFIFVIPFILAAGPIGGFILGSYLKDTFGLSSKITIFFPLVGLAASLMQTIRIIKVLVKLERKP